MNENNIIVSIIVPVYNTSNYLSKCLDSILNQTIENLEVIVVNDGSTDQSKRIIEEYCLKDSRIRAFHQKNQGVSAARNNGISSSKGEYLIFVDSDDYIHNEMLEELVSAARKYNALITKCDVYYVKRNELKELDYKDDNIKSIESTEALKQLFTIFDETHFGYTHSKLYNRDFIVKNDLKFHNEMSFAEDTLFFLEACILAKSVVYIPKQLYYYNLTNVSLTRTYIKNLDSKYELLHSALEDKMKLYNVYTNLERYYLNFKVTGLLSILGNEARNTYSFRKKAVILWSSLKNLVSNNKNLLSNVSIDKLDKLPFKKRILFNILKIINRFIK